MNARCCPHCRRVSPPGASFCTGCGAALNSASAPAAAPAPSLPAARAESCPALAAGARASRAAAPPANLPPGGKRVGPAIFLHVIYPGLGLLYAEAVGLALAHLLINTVAIGVSLVILVRSLHALVQGQQPWDEMLQLTVLLLALLLFWGQGLASTKRAVERYNRALTDGRPAGAAAGRVVALVVWELLALVILTGYLMVR